MKINVTREHIKTAKCGDARKCAVAQAIFEQVPGAKEVSVNGLAARINGLQFPLNKRVQQFISNFDNIGLDYAKYTRTTLPTISFELKGLA